MKLIISFLALTAISMPLYAQSLTAATSDHWPPIFHPRRPPQTNRSW